MIQTEWDKTFREALSEFLELPLDRVIKQGQAEGLATSNAFCTFFLEGIEQSFDTYQGDGEITAWYLLTYVISIYDKKATNRAQSLMLRFHQQRAKDVLNPVGLKYRDATILNNFIEYINDIGYNRTDLTIQLAAEYSEPYDGYIESITYGLNFEHEDKSWHKV